MSAASAREKLLHKLRVLNEIAEFPNLYLANYFANVRNEVDNEIALKLLEMKNDIKQKRELNYLWKTMIDKIDSFEKKCMKDYYDLEINLKRLNEIEKKLRDISLFNEKEDNFENEAAFANFYLLAEEITNEENNLLETLFQNKTLDWKFGRLFLLNNCFIDKKSLEKA